MNNDILDALLTSDAAITSPDRERILGRIHQLEREIAATQRERATETDRLKAVAALVADDCHAVTFQSLGQYRRNIIKFIDKHLEAPCASSPT